MKTVKLLFFSLFFCVQIQASTPVASIIFSVPPVENNLTHFTVTDPNNEPYTIQTIIGSEACRQIPSGKYGYFNASSVIASTDANLIFRIRFYDYGTGFFYLHYNATNSVNYKVAVVQKGGSNTWVTATIAVTDASFRNAQNNNCDFRIGTNTGDNNYIASISIEKGTLNPASEPVPTTTASSYSEFKGKAVAGYQAWFKTGNASSGWFHWANNTQPAVGNLNFELYPEVSEYAAADLAQTGFANCGNGTPSKLFNSANTTVINKHFDWMTQKGIDGVALQRFINGIGTVINDSKEAIPMKVKAAAEENGRIFYICYDITSTGLDDTWDDIIKFDWVYNIEQTYALTASPAYAKVGNKPVVQIWGTGFTGNHPGTAAETIALIQFLQARGCYVIGGVPTYWRTGTNDSKNGFIDAYKAYDMISPWSVGRFGTITEANNFKTNLLVPDKTYTDQLGIDYMPVLFAGFAWSQWNTGLPNAIPRQAGSFFWQQALNSKSIGIENMYFAMFDEYDESTALMNAATDFETIPTNQYFLTLSADGTWVSSDFYLRLAGAATQLLKGTQTPTTTVPIPYSEGPVYYRNSFEKRSASYSGGSGIYPIDPCFNSPSVLTNSGVTDGSVVIENNATYAKSGTYTAKINGTAASATNAAYYYKIAVTKIPVSQNMQLRFWKYTVNNLGRFTNVDLQFASGKVLRDLSVYKDNTGNGMHPGNGHGTVGSWEQFSCLIGTGELINDEITGIVIAYDHPAASGTFTAYFDNIVIDTADNPSGIYNCKPIFDWQALSGINSLILTSLPIGARITISNLQGQVLRMLTSTEANITIPLSKGIYLVRLNEATRCETQKVLIK
jgi:hypothetical protein